ncbi:CDP-glycerol glycerophosphotransferase family protein [Botryobacter ruber]|uniref:CDP-glycerol glycerophosphotransferase family protein n=1 Tax=Botryobacter ruber TaxID=2171629 RepID=UPI001F0B7FC9|nr:CDP-glycerol glycerophosphotransferase family protein [Botryobacter ruber]
MLEKTAALYRKILHIRLTDTFAGLPPHALEPVSPNNPLKRLLKVLLYTGGRLVLNLFKVNKPIGHLQGKVWLYVVSQNNYDSLRFLAEALPDTAFVAGQNKNIGKYGKQVNRLSFRFKLLYYYKFPFVLWSLYKSHGRRALRFFDLVYDAIGFYEIYLRLLKQYRPAAIVFANDHNADARAMLYAAKAHSIPTIYIQHASVSTSFPPLEHDLSLLEGQDALDKYKQCGPIRGEVQFIGMPKADVYIQHRKAATPVRYLGICCNTIDSTQGIRAVVQLLTQKFPELQLTVRPHPRDTRDFSFLQALNPHIVLSDAKKENAFDFLLHQDLIIAGDSSIHLEAVMLNIPGIYYKFDKDVALNDYYGYAQQGLVEQANAAPELAALIQSYRQHRPDVYLRAQYYNATVGTANDGRSSELAITYIREYLKF